MFIDDKKLGSWLTNNGDKWHSGIFGNQLSMDIYSSYKDKLVDMMIYGY